MEHLESDLSVASYLLASGSKLLGLEAIGTRYSFRFENSNNKVTQAVEDYHKGALIPARDFAAAIQRLKTVLYAEKYREERNRNGYSR